MACQTFFPDFRVEVFSCGKTLAELFLTSVRMFGDEVPFAWKGNWHILVEYKMACGPDKKINPLPGEIF